MDAAYDSESNSTMNSQEDQSLRELALRDLARSRQVEQALLSAVTWDLVDSLRAAAQLAASSPVTPTWRQSPSIPTCNQSQAPNSLSRGLSK